MRRARRRAPRREEARRQVAAGPEREEVPHHLQVDLRRRLHFPGADAAVHGRDLGARRGSWLLARDGALLSCLRGGGEKRKCLSTETKKLNFYEELYT